MGSTTGAQKPSIFLVGKGFRGPELSVAGVSFVHVIDEDVRELLSALAPGVGSCTPAERIDRIKALDRAANMIQAALTAETAAFAQQRRGKDRAAGAPDDAAGRGAAFEIAMARRVSKATVDHQLAFAEGPTPSIGSESSTTRTRC
jgi:hypothetical protein